MSTNFNAKCGLFKTFCEGKNMDNAVLEFITEVSWKGTRKNFVWHKDEDVRNHFINARIHE